MQEFLLLIVMLFLLCALKVSFDSMKKKKISRRCLFAGCILTLSSEDKKKMSVACRIREAVACIDISMKSAFHLQQKSI